MVEVGFNDLLGGKDADARVEIARRVGGRLCLDDLPQVERQAAEELARHLVKDAIERVRCELSECVKSAPHLARDVAMKIAHDVDSVASPFLEATEIFSDDDWQQLVLTISRGARVAVARRTSMSEGLAVSLAQVGDTVVVQTLVENPSAPMTPPVCAPVLDRFSTSTWILDKLAERNDLNTEIAAQLVAKVSEAARRKLARTYKMPDLAERVMSEVEVAAVLKLVNETPTGRMPALAKRLHEDGLLTFDLLLAALKAAEVRFFEAALAQRSGIALTTVQNVLHRGSDGQLTAMLSRVEVPRQQFAAFWDLLARMRRLGLRRQ